MYLCSLFCPSVAPDTMRNLPSFHLIFLPSLPLPCSTPLYDPAILCGALGVNYITGSILHCSNLPALRSLCDTSYIAVSLHVGPSHILPHSLYIRNDISPLASSLENQHNHSFYGILSNPPPVLSCLLHRLSCHCTSPCRCIICHHCQHDHIGRYHYTGQVIVEIFHWLSHL